MEKVKAAAKAVKDWFMDLRVEEKVILIFFLAVVVFMSV